MNELRPAHAKVTSVDIAPSDELKGNDEREQRTSDLVRERLPAVAPRQSLRREYNKHVPNADLSARLEQGIFDDTVSAYLLQRGWNLNDLSTISVELSVAEADDSRTPKEVLCSKLVRQAVDKKNVGVFLIVPKSEALIAQILELLKTKIDEDPDSAQIYLAMREKIRQKPPYSGLHKLI